MYFSEIKEIILKTIDKEISLNTSLDEKFGDFSFYLPKDLKIELDFDFIEKTEIINNYLNIFIKKEILFESIILEILQDKENKNQETIVLEYLSPNTNKPLHLGHLRNGAIGSALANCFKELGFRVVKANLINDRGEHICKSMLAYQKWGQGETPESVKMKGDHFVGYWYVFYNTKEKENPELKKEVNLMLKKWEEGDQETIKLWQKMNNWVYQGFEETYKNFGLSFDKNYYESNIYKLGKEIIEQGIKKEVFYRGKDQDILFNLPAQEFGLNKDGSRKKITVLRKDQTSVYLTQDLALAVLKKQEHDFNQSIYIVGLEQNYYFKCLFYILDALGYDWVKNCYHISYGMVFLPEGKMKSREGKIIDADNLIQETQDLVQEKYNIKDKDHALKISLAAIKFNLLSVQSKQDIYFDPQKSIALEGKTGPYCQYALARAFNILEKAEIKENPNFSFLKEDKEIILIRQLSLFSETIKKSIKLFNPSLVANYVYDTAKIFNQFYDSCSVLRGENEEIIQARLYLVKAFSIIMKKGLTILNISSLEKM